MIEAAKLFEAIELECEIGPTDKQYKIYVDLIEPNPDELRVVSAITFDPPTDELESGKWLRADPAILQKDGWSTGTGYKWMQVQKRGPRKFGKFYFQHFNEEERRRFFDLYISKKMKIGVPGYFYVLPFFMTRRKL